MRNNWGPLFSLILAWLSLFCPCLSLYCPCCPFLSLLYLFCPCTCFVPACPYCHCFVPAVHVLSLLVHVLSLFVPVLSLLVPVLSLLVPVLSLVIRGKTGLLLNCSLMQNIFNEFEKEKKIIFWCISNKRVYTINIVTKCLNSPAGVPNKGLRKKLNLKYCLNTRNNLLRPEVFFLRASRNNWCYFENATVNLNMHCLLVCLYFQSVSMGLLKSRFLQILGCQKPSPYLGRLQQAFFVYTKHYQVEVHKKYFWTSLSKYKKIS